MNKENVQHAINIMERCQIAIEQGRRNFNMSCWQLIKSGSLAKTEAELHACGNSACFAGYVAVSPEFRACGGAVTAMGQPSYPYGPGRSWKAMGADAIAKWLEIPLVDAEILCATSASTSAMGMAYGYKPFTQIMPEDVLAVLYRLLGTGDIRGKLSHDPYFNSRPRG